MTTQTLVNELTIMAGMRPSVTDMTVVKRKLELLRPLERLWLGEADYRDPKRIDGQSILRSIAVLTGTPLDAFEVSIITDGTWDLLPRYQSDYSFVLATMLKAESAALLKAHHQVDDATETAIIGKIVGNLTVYHAINGPSSIMDELAIEDIWRLIIQANVEAVSACYLAIVHEDDEALSRLAPIVRLLAQILPIGIAKDAGPKWILVSP